MISIANLFNQSLQAFTLIEMIWFYIVLTSAYKAAFQFLGASSTFVVYTDKVFTSKASLVYKIPQGHVKRYLT